MCGIVGYIGKQQAAPILLDGLAKLEYRGYDSAGVCVFGGSGFEVAKVKGRLAGLNEMIDGGAAMRGSLGIGHTRWATHGAPSQRNSHPHVSTNGKISVVHNGIIENYLILKEYLLAHGKSFASDTDTEVAANLLEYYYELEGDLLKAARRAVEKLSGSYALGILCTDCPDTLLAVKKDSPLIVGFGNGENFIASDVPAILKYTREVVYLNDGDMVLFRGGEAEFYNKLGEAVEKLPEHISWEMSAAEKGGYPHFMLKEIFEQPKALRDTISDRIKGGRVNLGDVHLSPEYLRGIRRIYIVACGSAYYVGCVGKYVLEKTCRIPVEPILASEFRYSEPVLGDDTLVIIISQSGETADTLAALREANELGAHTLAIVNVVGSAISKAAHDVIYTWAGPEIAVATTKAYSTQLSVLYLLALYIGDLLGTLSVEEYEAMLHSLNQLPELLSTILTEDFLQRIRQLANDLKDNHDVFFIGRNLDSATCLEGSLKLKEIAYVHSEAYAAGELKHGPISLIEDKTLVVAVAGVPELFEKTMSNVKEVKARGAEVLGLTTADLEDEIKKTVDRYLLVPKTHPLLQPSLNVVPLQIFSYYMALARGCDVDKPRNLAKSVTVE
ncbi:MAG: glutamine--fructose-6-phosphate transaminase (isomerizing) [Oscillospiraceae bacterium]|nr:glutamine--fructose-6-phosphate transaminase (isomerizing) [Oscillospiraceae bacterium]